MKLVPHVHRTKFQWIFFILLLTPLVRLTYLDMENVRMIFLGISIPKDKIFILILLGISVVGLVLYFSTKWGRFFCSTLCPVHLVFEVKNKKKKEAWSKPMMWLMAVLFSQSAMAFILPFSKQLELIKSQAFPQPILIMHLIVLGTMISIFVIYKERFCHSACPYAVFQGLLRNDKTVVTVYDDPKDGCINCRACDKVCPMRLDVRKESMESFCSNCTLCIDACAKVLGAGNEVITQKLEEELPENEDEGSTAPLVETFVDQGGSQSSDTTKNLKPEEQELSKEKNKEAETEAQKNTSVSKLGLHNSTPNTRHPAYDN